MNITDLFSQRTNEALQRAIRLAIENNQRAVDTEHILYALTEDQVVMKRIFNELGLKLEECKSLIFDYWREHKIWIIYSIGQSVEQDPSNLFWFAACFNL